MPKFNIYCSVQPGVNIETGEVVKVTPRRISVGWSRGQYAQLGIGHAVDPQDSALTALEKGTETAGSNLPVLGEVEMGQEWLAEWIDLDRHMINQLIRELRKARDAAFGRDE